MLKEAIEKIVSLATPEIYEIDGDTYTTKAMDRVAPHINQPKVIAFSSLDSIVAVIKAEINRAEITKPIFVNIDSHEHVKVFTTYRYDNLARDDLYVAGADLPRPFATWSGHDDAIIMLRSRFVPNNDVAYLLELLSRISSDDSVASEDNGVSQKVSATVGIALKGFENIRPRVLLAPYRTFLEVGQPESEFILRIKAGSKDDGTPPQIGIIEADGGAWKLTAKSNIANYFRANLADLVEQGSVVVTE